MKAPRWTELARQDLHSIREYIASDSRVHSNRMLQRILNAAESAARMPESGGIVFEFDDPLIREVLAGPYRIIYRLDGQQIEVLTVIHGARRLRLPGYDRN